MSYCKVQQISRQHFCDSKGMSIRSLVTNYISSTETPALWIGERFASLSLVILQNFVAVRHTTWACLGHGSFRGGNPWGRRYDC